MFFGWFVLGYLVGFWSWWLLCGVDLVLWWLLCGGDWVF